MIQVNKIAKKGDLFSFMEEENEFITDRFFVVDKQFCKGSFLNDILKTEEKSRYLKIAMGETEVKQADLTLIVMFFKMLELGVNYRKKSGIEYIKIKNIYFDKKYIDQVENLLFASSYIIKDDRLIIYNINNEPIFIVMSFKFNE